MTRILNEVKARFQDLVFFGLIVLCLLLTVGGIRAELARRESLLAVSEGRKIDVHKVREQIRDGILSSHPARFYKRLAD